jgi:Rad3-related DNA helicase
MTYKLPHLLDRPGQQDALDWILNSNKQYLILRAPTGFGKSPLAAACSIDFRTMALVLHKSLQSANYKDQYNFDILYGKANYPCLKRNEKLQSSFFDVPKFTAYDCSNPHCDCPYQRQELQCLSSLRVSLNYAKFLMSQRFSEFYQPEFLYLDEAHNLPGIVTNFVGLTLNWDNEFLQSYGRIKPQRNGRLDYGAAMSLFRQCARVVDSNKPKQKEDLVKWRKWKRLHTRVQITNEILTSGSLLDWYYESDDKQLIIKPLTAKYHFKRLFGVADKVVLMSATIGPSIAERLGLEDGEWDYHEVPNPWAAPSRIVYDLGGPAINYRSSGGDKEKQAKLIASVLDINKSGIIHVTSKSQAIDLLNLLLKIDCPNYHKDSLHIPSVGFGTEAQYQEWLDWRHPGAYCISWNFHEGVDLGQDDISVVAKTPYTSIGGNYEKAVMEYDPQWYLEQAAMKLEQACGRVRRGKSEHYIPGAKQVYIADSSWHRLKTLLSDDFRKSIRKYNGQ